ncbi:class gamma glutathione S-transferase [Gongronella butleri]|nr:class gamma glutathione S-transferase [Gongronella butleri]
MTLSGQTVTLHYFVINGMKSSRALGENVNLMLKDSGEKYEYLRHTGEEWKELKAKMQKEGIHAATMPMVEIDGKFYNKTTPTMRYLARKLGKYGGASEEQWHYLDSLADCTLDWFHSYRVFFREREPEAYKKHIEEDTKKYLGIFDAVYGQHGGPYILGEEISYVDFLVYHNIDDDHAWDLVKDYPNVAKFVQAFESRPNLAEYLIKVKAEEGK